MDMKPRLHLYCVTIPWARNDVEQGDFCENTWAVDPDAAIRAVAARMVAEDSAAGEESDVDHYVDLAGPYAAQHVASNLKHEIFDLLAGPKRRITKQNHRRYERIVDILTRAGIEI